MSIKSDTAQGSSDSLLITKAGTILWIRLATSQTIYDFQRGLKYRRGHLVGVFGPGRYTYLTRVDRLEIYDLRTALLQISGQDVLRTDQVISSSAWP